MVGELDSALAFAAADCITRILLVAGINVGGYKKTCHCTCRCWMERMAMSLGWLEGDLGMSISIALEPPWQQWQWQWQWQGNHPCLDRT